MNVRHPMSVSTKERAVVIYFFFDQKLIRMSWCATSFQKKIWLRGWEGSAYFRFEITCEGLNFNDFG